MSTVAIVNHSGYGHTHLQAEGVMRGVQSVSSITAHLSRCRSIGALGRMDAAEAIILVFLTSMGSMTAVRKSLLQAAA